MRFLAEELETCGAHASDASAERCEAEIEPQDLLLGERALELDGAHDLPQLHRRRAAILIVEQARDLHRQGGAAGDDAPVEDEIARRTQQSVGIDTVVRIEA